MSAEGRAWPPAGGWSSPAFMVPWGSGGGGKPWLHCESQCPGEAQQRKKRQTPAAAVWVVPSPATPSTPLPCRQAVRHLPAVCRLWRLLLCQPRQQHPRHALRQRRRHAHCGGRSSGRGPPGRRAHGLGALRQAGEFCGLTPAPRALHGEQCALLLGLGEGSSSNTASCQPRSLQQLGALTPPTATPAPAGQGGRAAGHGADAAAGGPHLHAGQGQGGAQVGRGVKGGVCTEQGS